MDESEWWTMFLAWETASRDCIDVKRLYIDMAGDLVSGVLLSQILYWHLPMTIGSETRMAAHGCGVMHEEKWWLVKKREDWWEECRITPKQFDRSSDVLIKKDYISIKRFHWHGLPTIHIHLHVRPFLASMKTILFPGNSNLTFGEVGTLPLGKLEFDQRSNYNNDNTREEISGETEREREDPSPTSPVGGRDFSLSVGQGNNTTPAPASPAPHTTPMQGLIPARTRGQATAETSGDQHGCSGQDSATLSAPAPSFPAPGSRAEGTNPRALGTDLRSQGITPRQVTKQVAKDVTAGCAYCDTRGLLELRDGEDRVVLWRCPHDRDAIAAYVAPRGLSLAHAPPVATDGGPAPPASGEGGPAEVFEARAGREAQDEEVDGGN